MQFVSINWYPSSREFRTFGLTMLGGGALLASIAWWRDHQLLAQAIATTGAVAGFLALTGTKAARLVYWPWMAIAFVMGNIMSRVLVALFYYLLITPMGVVMRFVARDSLRRKNSRESMWDDLPPSFDSARYERQY